MRLIVQRVLNASVDIDGTTVGKINQGLMVLLGITHTDTSDDMVKLSDKLLKLRVFNDANEKMNLSIKDVQGEILLVSQFTLYGDASKGNRPSFIDAARPELAKPLYEAMIKYLKEQNITVATGIFGADMQVNLINNGPVTIILDSQ